MSCECLVWPVSSVYQCDLCITHFHVIIRDVNRGADIGDKLQLETCDLGRGMQGVIGLCDVEGTAGTGVSCILTASV